jgi:hypothetical protein
LKIIETIVVSALSKGNNHIIKSLSGDLLGWSNHIVDSAECLIIHSEAAKKK